MSTGRRICTFFRTRRSPIPDRRWTPDGFGARCTLSGRVGGAGERLVRERAAKGAVVAPRSAGTASRLSEAALHRPAGRAAVVCQQPPVFFQAEDGIRDDLVTGVQTCALPI